MTIHDLFAPFADELQLLPSPRVPNPPLIEWTSAFGDFFFRVKGAEPEILWCVLGRGAPPKRPLSAVRRATLQKYLSPAYAGRTFFRVVPFEDGDDWALVRPKRALVKSPSQDKGAIWHWKADFGNGMNQLDWLGQPLAPLQNWLAEKPTRDLDIARAFACLGNDARIWSVYIGAEGVHERWKTLVPALQKLSFDPASELPRTTWRLREHGRTVTVVSDWTPQPFAIPDAANKLLGVLGKQSPLQCHQSRWRGIGVRGKEQLRSSPTFIVEAPSHHERLEAALLWRDFAAEIGKRDEIEPLLRELLAAG